LIADEPLEKFDMKIWPMFRQLAEEFSQDAADRGIEVCWEVEPDELTVKADRGILVQLLRQLVSNAVKFSPPKHPVRVTARRESDRVVFQVWDKGPGIEPRVQETIFEPLFQVDDPIRRSRGGLGLGLAIAKRCADRLGADLSLQSPLADGRGTVFQIVL
jgi:signal transduction histidine kinase